MELERELRVMAPTLEHVHAAPFQDKCRAVVSLFVRGTRRRVSRGGEAPVWRGGSWGTDGTSYQITSFKERQRRISLKVNCGG